MRAACAALSECKQQGSDDLVTLQRWSPGLRPSAPWESSSSETGELKHQHACLFPTTFEVYEAATKATPVAVPSSLSSDDEDNLLSRLKAGADLLPDAPPLPSLEEFFTRAAACTPPSVILCFFSFDVFAPLVITRS